MIISFGKHKGKEIEEIPSDYLKWLLEQNFIEEDSHTDLLEATEYEMAVRDRSYGHFYE